MLRRFFSGLLCVSLLFSALPSSFALGGGTPGKLFLDIEDDSQYYDALKYLKDKDVLSGYPDGSFRPREVVNRAEALKMITLAAKTTITASGATLLFSDVDNSAWYASYVGTAYEQGIVQGYPDGTFKPAQTINRVEALKIVYKAFAVDLSQIEVKEPPYGDTPVTPENAWFLPLLEHARRTNSADPDTVNTFAPQKGMTRGDIAELIYRLLYMREKQVGRFNEEIKGEISYYGNEFAGNGTSYGEILNQEHFMAASMDFPHESLLQVFNHNRDRSIVVKVADRGPYGHGRILDLTTTAFGYLAPLSSGVTDGSALSLGKLPGVKKFFYDRGMFSALQLDHDFPNMFYEGEVYIFSGTVTGGATQVTGFYTAPTGKQASFTAPVIQGNFTLPVTFGTEGKYQFTLVPGTKGAGVSASVQVTRPFAQIVGVREGNSPTDLLVAVKDGKTEFSWNGQGQELFKLVLTQGTKQVIRYINGASFYTVRFRDFEGFTPGEVEWYVEGASSSTGFSHDRYTTWARSEKRYFDAVTHEYTVYDRTKLQLEKHPQDARTEEGLYLSGMAEVPVRDKVLVIVPGGQVEEYPITAVNKGADGVIPSHTSFTLQIPMVLAGTYIVEINAESYEAVLNFPLYGQRVIPLIPNIHDLHDGEEIEKTVPETQVQYVVDRINKDRTEHGLSPLTLHTTLSLLAQDRAQDMVTRDYFAHVNPDGKSVNDLRSSYDYSALISENLAKDRALDLAYDGLMRSPGHRKNILNDEVTQVGIGVRYLPNGQLVLVQLFSGTPMNSNDHAQLYEEWLQDFNTKRSTPLSWNPSLHALAEGWATRMAEEGFFDVEDGKGARLESLLESNGILVPTKIFLLSSSSVDALKVQARDHTTLTDEMYTQVGLGIAQDNDGLLKVVVLYF